jgi:group I intron endonuclease
MTTASVIYSVYIITNNVNGKQYIGISKNIVERWSHHKSAKGDIPALHSAILKYGIDNFEFNHIANAFDVESAKIIERLLIVEYKTQAPNGYNLTMGGEGLHGFEHTEEIKNKISSSKKGKPSNRKGKKHSFESIQKMKDSHKGQVAWNKGTTGIVKAWNKGLTGCQTAWNKGLTGVVSWNDDAKKRQSEKVKAIWAKRKEALI